MDPKSISTNVRVRRTRFPAHPQNCEARSAMLLIQSRRLGSEGFEAAELFVATDDDEAVIGSDH